MTGDGSSSYVLSHVMRKPVPGRSHRAARRRTAQRDDRTVAQNAMDRMRLIDRPEENLSPPTYLKLSRIRYDKSRGVALSVPHPCFWVSLQFLCANTMSFQLSLRKLFC